MTRCTEHNTHDLRCARPRNHNNDHKFQTDKPGRKFSEGHQTWPQDPELEVVE
jgi:hypothetical protein